MDKVKTGDYITVAGEMIVFQKVDIDDPEYQSIDKFANFSMVKPPNPVRKLRDVYYNKQGPIVPFPSGDVYD
jgi:hypothetical protein